LGKVHRKCGVSPLNPDFQLVGRTALRNVNAEDLLLIPFPGHVEIAVAATVFLEVLLAVNARARNISVPLPIA
jgi:hypothetical protein